MLFGCLLNARCAGRYKHKLMGDGDPPSILWGTKYCQWTGMNTNNYKVEPNEITIFIGKMVPY